MPREGSMLQGLCLAFVGWLELWGTGEVSEEKS
jgi:hypothetical protein